jgi:hypothetical protein
MTRDTAHQELTPRLWGTRITLGLGALLTAFVGLTMTGSDGGIGQVLGQRQTPLLITVLILLSSVVMAAGVIGLGRRTPAGWTVGLAAAAVVLAWMALPALAVAWLVSFYAEVGLGPLELLVAGVPMMIGLLLAWRILSARHAFGIGRSQSSPES